MRTRRRFTTRLTLTAAGLLIGTSLLAAPAASAYHPQGGNYGYCAVPTEKDYQAVRVEGWGVGSDRPRNAKVAGAARVAYTHSCKRAGAKYYPVGTRITSIGVKINPFTKAYGQKKNSDWSASSARLVGAFVRPGCGKWIRTTFSYQVRYNDGRVFNGNGTGGWFKRCG